jgi:glycosyltransferase involved in cell wall biosynthesis
MKPKQLLFAPHSVDNNRFSSNPIESEASAQKWRAELSIEKDEIVFLFAGKLTPKKAPGLLIEAFVALNQPNTKLVVIGNGELEHELKQRYKDYTNVIFNPFQNQSQMPVVYRLANVFVLPSTGPGETWGLAVNEAMACSRAVIVSDKCGCAQDLVHGGVNGYVFKSGDVKSLRDCMHVSLNNYRELGVNSYKIIQGYTYEETVRQLQRIDLILGPSP